MKILIIEDEQAIAFPVMKVLESSNYAVDYAANGIDGLKLAEVNGYDCIVLDLNLPGIDGISLATKLRNTQNTTPIIMLTARSQIYDKLEGFDSGADDYITKPFDMQELLARIKAVIMRNGLNKAATLQLGPWTIQPERNIAIDNKDNQVMLSNKETALVEYLIRNKGRIVSTEEILEHVWESEVDTFSDTVKTHIKTLRQKLDPDKSLLQTFRGKGYLVS